jgi:RNA polymerase nonessential primary-like sigma factor
VVESAALLTADEERHVARQARAGDQGARDLLAARNHGLVFDAAAALARRLPPGMELADLVQEGHLALYRAAGRYDPERGTRFSTYATRAIRAQMLIAIYRWRYPIRPTNARPGWIRVLAAHERAAAEGRNLSVLELAAAAGCRCSTVCRTLAAVTPPVCLDQGWEGDDEPEDRETLLCPRAPSEAAIVARLQVEAAVARLPARWQAYIRLRFGLDGGECYTQVEAARELGCHRTTAAKMEQAALARLKQLMSPRRRRPQAGG